jgi:transaldolase
MAVALGARYAAPYLGRITDGGMNGIDEVNAMQRIIEGMESPVRLLLASIREAKDLVILAEKGLNTFTLLPSLIEDLVENQLTKLAAESFQTAVDPDSE